MFRTRDDYYYMMPAHFGGEKFDPEGKAVQKAAVLTINYETDRLLLENFIPEGFELLKPEVHLQFSGLTEINWMAGSEYNFIKVTAPVRFNGKQDQITGDYVLVLWENKTAPILGGREQTGMPKIFADIEDLHIVKPYYSTTVSYEGNTFLNMDFEAKEAVTGGELKDLREKFTIINALAWRYIPKVGGPGADLNQFILYPQALDVETAVLGEGNFSWTEMTPMQNPTQYQIINNLASLPVKKINKSMLLTGISTLYPMGSKVIK